MTAADAVVLRDLRRRYGPRTALAGMSWGATAGQVTAVLGPNGAGKTTAVECAEGLRRPDGGSVRVLGVDPWGAGPDHRARVGVMLQDGGLPGGARPMALLRHVSAFYDSPADGRADVAALADRLGVAGLAGTSVRRLSGGERQRLALAVALVARPEVAFLDEPTAGLDPHARLQVWALLVEHRDRGCAVVVTTHSFEEAERVADRVVIVSHGRTVAAGTLDQVRAGRSLEDVYFGLTREASS